MKRHKSARWGNGVAIFLLAGFFQISTAPNQVATAATPQVIESNLANVVQCIDYQDINNTDTLFYAGRTEANGNYSPSFLYESQRTSAGWTTQQIPGTANVGCSSVVTIGGTTYIGFNSTTVLNSYPYGNIYTVSVISNANGNWQSVYSNSTTPNAASSFGNYIRLTSENGNLVAAYTSPAAFGSSFSSNVTVLDKLSSGGWQTSTIPLSYNPGVIGISLQEISGSLDALLAFYSGGTDVLARRTGGPSGAWSTTGFPQYNDDVSPSLANLNGQADFFATTGNDSYKSASYYNSVSGTGRSSIAVGPAGDEIVGADLESIDGVATLAYLDRADLSVHFGQLSGGQFNGTVLDDDAAADYGTSVKVFQGTDGNTDVAYFNDLGPSGPDLQVIEVPEPGNLFALLILCLVLYLSLRRATKTDANTVADTVDI